MAAPGIMDDWGCGCMVALLVKLYGWGGHRANRVARLYVRPAAAEVGGERKGGGGVPRVPDAFSRLRAPPPR